MNGFDNFLCRVASYKDWPLNFPSAYSLADIGLFYSGSGDKVCCFKCCCCISDWKEGDIPSQRHKIVSPNCPLVASFSLPVSETEPAFLSGHATNAAAQFPVTYILPKQESFTETVHQTSPQQESCETGISRVPASRHGDFLTCSASVRSGASQNAHFKSEAVRLRTFVNWSCEHVTPESLAKAGFYPMNVGDCVKCAYCDGVLKNWEPGDIPAEEHIKHFPNCHFARELHERTGSVARELHERTGSVRRTYKDSLQIPACVPNSANLDDPFSDVNHRKLSFANYSHLLRNQNPDDFADAGFYYVGPDDRVKCFSCGGVLGNWSPSDVPWQEHAKWFQHCEFLLKRKGLPFIENVLRSHCMVSPSPPVGHEEEQRPAAKKKASVPTISPSDEGLEDMTKLKQPYLPSIASSLLPSANEKVAISTANSCLARASSSANLNEQLKIRDEELENTAKKDDKLSDVLLCKICMDEMANTVFLPCGHLLCCEHCAPAVSECPVCRGTIKGTLKVYIS